MVHKPRRDWPCQGWRQPRHHLPGLLGRVETVDGDEGAGEAICPARGIHLAMEMAAGPPAGVVVRDPTFTCISNFKTAGWFEWYNIAAVCCGEHRGGIQHRKPNEANSLRRVCLAWCSTGRGRTGEHKAARGEDTDWSTGLNTMFQSPLQHAAVPRERKRDRDKRRSPTSRQSASPSPPYH